MVVRRTCLCRRLTRVSLLLGAALFAGCDSPTSPSGCDDPYGRTPTPYVVVQCVPSGANLSCDAIRRETGYCADPTPLSFTRQVRWVSSDEAIARFVEPGQLRILSAGDVVVHVEWPQGTPTRHGEQAFRVAPGRAPERLAQVGVTVFDATTGNRLPAASVELRAPGETQTCRADQFAYCRFWVSLTDVVLRASREGFQPAEVNVTPLADCYCGGTTIRLTPAPSQ